MDTTFGWGHLASYSFHLTGYGNSQGALVQETRERWDRKVDRIACGNPPAKENAQCNSATMTVQPHAMVVYIYACSHY